jgi:glycerol-3-phosphate dehydrogenase
MQVVHRPSTTPAAAPFNRAAVLATLAAERFDVLVVGGGITGAGIAREAALAGYRTALLERDDFASGTSSRSSRLVHGGVRYLEHGHFGLVFESSRERRLLLHLAPHLVRPLAFTWPVYRGARVPLWKVRAGLMLYDGLALFRNVQRHEGLDVSGVLAHEPALARDGLRGGARYWDAATDDTRLTLATALAAVEAGAVVINHCAVTGAIGERPGRLGGVAAVDALSGDSLAVRARVVINATGPWSDATAALTGNGGSARDGTGTGTGAQILGSAGSHITVPRHRLGNMDAVTIVSPVDGRVLFVLPAGSHAIIGTTERPARRGPDEIRATRTEITYLLETVNHLFPHAALTPDDVISAWCGIRPLAAARAGERSATAASREHAITRRADGLVSVTGGKLTTYRAMAADVLTQARHEFGESDPVPSLSPRSLTQPLPGGNIGSREAIMADARAETRDPAVGERLALAYGSTWRSVWHLVQQDASLGQRVHDGLPYLLAEVVHAVMHEFACTPADVLMRRTHVAFETRDHGRAAARRIAPFMQTLRGWSAADVAEALAHYDREADRLFSVDDA